MSLSHKKGSPENDNNECATNVITVLNKEILLEKPKEKRALTESSERLSSSPKSRANNGTFLTLIEINKFMKLKLIKRDK